MPENHILLLPREDYPAWIAACRDYVIKFGPNFTNDPDSVGRSALPGQVVTIVDVPSGYPAQGDIRAWFERNYPTIKTDVVAVKTADELRAALAKRIQANDRYLSLAPVFDFGALWPAGKCLVGVHGRADGRMEPADFTAVAEARVEAVKLLSSAAPEDVDRLRAINPQVFILVRLFANIAGRVIPPEQFATWLTFDMGQFYQRGVRYFEIHNEPNLKGEGWTTSWQDGREFARWWLTVRNQLKALYPEARFGWPGLSPDGFPVPERTNDIRFLEQAEEALRAADFVCLHAYWRDEAEMRAPNGGELYREYRRRFPEKLLFVSEFSNPTPNTSLQAKAAQYVDYYAAARRFPGLGAVFAFIVSASANFPHEAWRTEDGQLTEIVSAVGRRTLA